MIVKLLTEHHLQFLSLKVGCGGSSESIHVKMPHCWKSYVMAHISLNTYTANSHAHHSCDSQWVSIFQIFFLPFERLNTRYVLPIKNYQFFSQHGSTKIAYNNGHS